MRVTLTRFVFWMHRVQDSFQVGVGRPHVRGLHPRLLKIRLDSSMHQTSDQTKKPETQANLRVRLNVSQSYFCGKAGRRLSVAIAKEGISHAVAAREDKALRLSVSEL